MITIKTYFDEKNIYAFTLCIAISIGFVNLQAQTLDYTTVGYSASLCNVFNISPVRVVNGKSHYPVSGGVSYNGTQLVLQTHRGTGLSTTLGTAFAFGFTIRQSYKYTITVNVFKQSSDPVSSPTMEIGVLSSLPDYSG